MTVPSIGDILMLSQKAWKIGRTFYACQKNAPAEFHYVETEIGSLAKALKLLAEALHTKSERELFQGADQEIKNGIGNILKSCQRTVDDLDSLIDQYQVIKKHRTVGGFAIERSWSDLVIASYRTMIWTTEGGDLANLRETLQRHTSSIAILIEALQSKSMTRLESVVTPMAERIDNVCHSVGSLDQQLDEVHRTVENLIIAPSSSHVPSIPARNPARSPTIEATNPLGQTLYASSPPSSPPKDRKTKVSLPRIPQHPRSPKQSLLVKFDDDAPVPSSSPTETLSTSRASSPSQKRVSGFSFGGSSLRYSSSSYASSDAGTSSAGWQSPLPLLHDSHLSRQQSTSTKKTSPLPRTPEELEPGQKTDSRHLTLLPPPAMRLGSPSELERTSTQTSQVKLSPYPSSPEIKKLHRSSTTASQKATFEKEAFRNSAILCDVRGSLVEYSHRINQDDPRDVEMIQASEECRIAVVRKRVTDSETRAVRVVTSVWAFSDDNTTRVELRMEDDQMYIPYSSYFNPAKVSITVPCELKFHDIKHGNRPAHIEKTSWVSYVFDSPRAAVLFQNELMGRTLLATFRTEKTMRIHEGLSKSFSYAEQMCGLENLRVWEDNDTGAIIALIHFSADFRNGYLVFYLNSSVNPIKVKDDGSREVKIKGLRVPIDRGDRAMRKDSVAEAAVRGKGKEKAGSAKAADKEKVISGAKIEFATDLEKKEFLAMCKEMQRNLIELPDLLGVN